MFSSPQKFKFSVVHQAELKLVCEQFLVPCATNDRFIIQANRETLETYCTEGLSDCFLLQRITNNINFRLQ